jgi:hypothetical protein
MSSASTKEVIEIDLNDWKRILYVSLSSFYHEYAIAAYYTQSLEKMKHDLFLLQTHFPPDSIERKKLEKKIKNAICTFEFVPQRYATFYDD